MATVSASATKTVEATQEQVMAFLRDYRESRPRTLTDHCNPYEVEVGGQARRP